MRLYDFAVNWLERPTLAVPDAPVVRAGPHMGVTLVSSPPYLVQHWICPPDSAIGEHAHLNAEGFAVLLAGDLRFTVDGQPIGVRGCDIARFGATKVLMVHVCRGVRHSARIGKGGGSFFAITRWLGEVPLSVHLDWDGEPLDEAHKAALGR